MVLPEKPTLRASGSIATVYERGFTDFHYGISDPFLFINPDQFADWRRGWEEAFQDTLDSALSQGAPDRELGPLWDFRRRMIESSYTILIGPSAP